MMVLEEVVALKNDEGVRHASFPPFMPGFEFVGAFLEMFVYQSPVYFAA